MQVFHLFFYELQRFDFFSQAGLFAFFIAIKHCHQPEMGLVAVVICLAVTIPSASITSPG